MFLVLLVHFSFSIFCAICHGGVSSEVTEELTSVKDVNWIPKDVQSRLDRKWQLTARRIGACMIFFGTGAHLVIIN